MQRRDGRFLPAIVMATSAAAVIATRVLALYGIYFFFFILPIFGLPWSIKNFGATRQGSSGTSKTCASLR